MKEKELKDLSYEELEKEADLVLSALSKEDVPLDEAARMYEYGKKITKEMETRLSDLSKKVKDEVEGE